MESQSPNKEIQTSDEKQSRLSQAKEKDLVTTLVSLPCSARFKTRSRLWLFLDMNWLNIPEIFGIFVEKYQIKKPWMPHSKQAKNQPITCLWARMLPQERPLPGRDRDCHCHSQSQQWKASSVWRSWSKFDESDQTEHWQCSPLVASSSNPCHCSGEWRREIHFPPDLVVQTFPASPRPLPRWSSHFLPAAPVSFGTSSASLLPPVGIWYKLWFFKLKFNRLLKRYRSVTLGESQSKQTYNLI